MSEEKHSMSEQDLENLLNDLAPAAGESAAPPAEAELEQTVAAILRQTQPQEAPGSLFDPMPAPGTAAVSQSARPQVGAGQGPGQKSARTPAAAPRREKSVIPPQAQRPFVADEGLKLDDNPLVNEDFRRFFTTSVTPDALFSSNTQSVPVRRAAAQMPEDDEENAPPAPPRRRARRGLLEALRSFFLTEETEEPDEEPAEEDSAEEAETLREEQPTASPAQPNGEGAAPESLFPPKEPQKASGSTVLFEKPQGTTLQAAAPQETPQTATAVFERAAAPAQQDAARPAASAQAGPGSLFDTALPPQDEQPADAAAAPAGAAADAAAAPRPSAPSAADEEDYNDPAQRSEIAAVLKGMVTSLTLRAAVLGVLAFNALYFGTSAIFPALPQPAGLVVEKSRGIFVLTVYLVSLLAAGGVSFPSLKSGWAGLTGKAPSADSFALLSWVGALVQNLALLAGAGRFDPAAQTVFAGFAILALFANTLGKRSLARGVQNNFERLTGGELQYSVASLVTDAGLVRRLTHGLEEQEPYLLVSRPTSFYCGFLHQSFAVRQGDRAAARLCRWLPVLAVLGGVLGVVCGSGFVQPFAGVLCIACPLSAVLLSAVPTGFLNRGAAKIGAVLPGPQSLEDLGQANVVTAQAQELFPTGSVTLKGMKVFGEPRIDLAILYAASLLVPNCPTLRDVFLNIIQNRTEILCKMENVHCEVGCGLEGWTQSRHLLVGNRGMMLSHGVETPPEAYENRYTKDGRYCPVYLAVNGKLHAMFVLGYRPNADVKEMLDEIYLSGLSLLVTGEDFNLTGDRISTLYGIPEGCIKVLGAAESEQLTACTAYCSRAEGVMAHTASFKGFIEGIRIAANAAGAEKAAGLIQTISVALGALLVLVLSVTGGVASLNAPAILLYQLAWLLLTLLLPFAKQY